MLSWSRSGSLPRPPSRATEASETRRSYCCSTLTGYTSMHRCHRSSWRSTIRCGMSSESIRLFTNIFSRWTRIRSVELGRLSILIELQTVTPDSLNRLIACTADDQRIIGICGETKLANENESLTTMIQVSYVRSDLEPELIRVPGLRVLHLPPPYESLRVPLRVRHLSSRMFLRLSNPYRRQRSTRYHLVTRHRRIRRTQRRYSAQEEPLLPGRRSIPYHADDEAFPDIQDEVHTRCYRSYRRA